MRLEETNTVRVVMKINVGGKKKLLDTTENDMRLLVCE
jgi:hypothetical protein